MVDLNRHQIRPLLFLITSFVAWCTPLASADQTRVRGEASLTSVGSPSDRVLWHLRPEVLLQFNRELGQARNVIVDAQVRARADSQSDFLASQRRFDLRFDRLVLEWLGRDASLTAGTQIWSWGHPSSFDGVDVLNPIDLSEPLFSDRNLSKIAVPAVSIQFLGENSIFQLIWVVQAQRSPVPDEVNGIHVKKPQALDLGEEMEFGVKAGGLTKSGWDINGYWSSHLERVPQALLELQSGSPEVVFFEPRVFTLGLTATQSIDEFVLRAEAAYHANRAVPEALVARGESSGQLVVQSGVDWNISSETVVLADLMLERWGRESSEQFESSSEYGSLGIRSLFRSGTLETQFNYLLDSEMKEDLLSGKIVWKFWDVWELSVEVTQAHTSNGRALARRRIRDLIGSKLVVKF